MKRIKEGKQLVAVLEGGELNNDLSRAMHTVVEGLCERAEGNNRKHKGSVTLKLNMEVEGDTVKIIADLAEKLPKTDRRASHYFHDGTGDLLTEHPDQRSVFDQDQPLRTVE